MKSKKIEKIGKHTYRETKVYNNGSQTRTTYTPGWFGRDVKSREYVKPSKKGR
jgi:hypothetical protein